MNGIVLLDTPRILFEIENGNCILFLVGNQYLLYTEGSIEKGKNEINLHFAGEDALVLL